MRKNYEPKSFFKPLHSKKRPTIHPDSDCKKNSNFSFLLTALLILSFSQAFSQTVTVPFTGSGSWTCPAGVTSIKVEAYGAGGGGGYGGGTNKQGGGGGGGGAYIVNNTVAVTPSTNYTITIGTAGIAGASADGGDGGNTTATFGATTVTANGGKGGKRWIATTGGVGGNGGAAGTYAGGNGGSTSGSGTYYGGGGGGGCAGTTGIGGNGQSPLSSAINGGGTAGGGMAGAGGAGQSANAGTGTAGSIYGAGGGGGTKNSNGAAGAGGYLLITYTMPAPSNDEPCAAINLPVNLSCSYTTYTNANATASAGVPAPGCASYSGGDVWFSLTVPASGEVTVDLQTGVITDSGMAFYTGTCGALTLLECDDDDSANGAMSSITRTGLTPGATIWVRVWEYGNDNNGTFGICASTQLACTAPTAQGTSLLLTQPSNGTINGSFTAASPAPSNYLVVYNTTGVAPSPTNATSYTIGGTVGAGNIVADNDTNTTFSVSGLSASTTYYFFVFSFNNNSCSGGPLYLTTSPTTANATVPAFYCASTSTSSTYYVNNFSTTLGTTNITNNGSGYSATGYGNFTGQNVTQQQFASVNFSAAFTGGTFGFNIWVDWNNDYDFNDAGEKVYGSGAYVSTATGSITVPGTASVGAHRMRIVADYLSTDPASCGSISSGETEDYTFTVTASSACTTPTAQPTSLVLTQPSNGTINGSFTAASPAPTNYLVVYNTTGVAPSPVNGTTYTVGSTVGAGNIVADVDNNTTFSVTGLTGATTYYFFVFSDNAICTGGPLYLTTSPLTNNATVPFYYCTANNSTNTTYYISGITTAGGAANFSNTGTGFSATGYADYTGTYSVSQNAGLGFSITATHPSSTYGYSVWVDWNNDGDFTDSGESILTTSYLSSPAAVGTVTIPAGTPAGNYRMRIRNAYSSNPAPACGDHAYGETEDYRIVCLGPLPCSGNPSGITVNVTSLTTATVNWTAAIPAPANGYQYFYSTSNTDPVYATAPTGSTGAGVTTAGLTGLTSGATYYIWVRSNCGGGLGQGAWIGPITFYVPNCTIGDGTGTSALACPSVLSGGLGLNGADPAAIDCTSASNCVDLEATYLQLGETSTYTVEAIPYNPPYQFGCLQNPVSVNSDDVWSPAINLPFNFCFYGNSYNQCSIGSNGVLTFDIARAGTASGYSFSNSLPSTTGALFANTIYGVYHDIDPSVGGEVGWELITLDTGCRALVASWSNVPMFSNNTILYTGMMVLYENTNVIEVYIKEKSIDGTWNGGNAIVGVQNVGGTQAVVAPGRNGLDADWTTTNEAWRFVPAGTSITSLKWYQGSGTTGPMIGTTDVINVCPATTTTYTAEVTYTLCNGSTLIETEETTVTVSGNKVWNGSVSSDWSNANNWTPAGVPTNTDCVVIPNVATDPIISGSAYTGLALNLTIHNSAVLTVNSANNLSVVNWVDINAGGDLIIQDDASLVQTNNSANIGTAHILRTTQPLFRLDYTYWNSPVTAASAFTVGNLTSSTPYIYRYLPTVSGGNGTWSAVGTGTVMTPNYGIIARAPGTFPVSGTKQTYTVNFTGTPNNGPISMPIAIGTNANIGTSVGGAIITDADDEWNLIGNPYPSAVNIVSFLNDPANVPVVDGTIYLWTHNTLPTSATPDPFYGNYAYNYTVSDYATVNSLGATATAVTGGTMPTQYIGAGQSFFISAETNGNVTFNNSMRVLNNNSNFYRDANEGQNQNGFASQRLWLNLSNNNGGFSQILVGYAEGATLGWDRGLDGETLAGNAVKFYSLMSDKKLTIQGRPWPFAQEDIVPLGFKATANNTYSIGIDHFDTQFENSNIYLEDRTLNIVHNLKLAPYSFTSTVGTFDNRFVLRYTESTLGNDDVSAVENAVVVYTNEKLKVNSTLEPIKEVVIYDVLGRILVNGKKVDSNEFTASTLNPTDSTLVVKVTLENGVTVTKKVIY